VSRLRLKQKAGPVSQHSQHTTAMQLWTFIMGVVLLMAPTVQAVQLCNGFAELCNRSYGVLASPACGTDNARMSALLEHMTLHSTLKSISTLTLSFQQISITMLPHNWMPGFVYCKVKDIIQLLKFQAE